MMVYPKNLKEVNIYPAKNSQFKSGKYKIVKGPKCLRGTGEGSRHVLDSSLPRDLSGNGWIIPGRCRQGFGWF